MGVSATMVPTDVPMDREMKQAAMKSPANSICGGRQTRVRLTVAKMLPITFAEFAKAPARTKIQIISIICCVAAPRLKVSMRSFKGRPRWIRMA